MTNDEKEEMKDAGDEDRAALDVVTGALELRGWVEDELLLPEAEVVLSCVKEPGRTLKFIKVEVVEAVTEAFEVEF